jgi:thiamine-phosphate pyrophosphorylase
VIVQCRDRQLPDGERLRWARQLRELTRESGQWLLVNDRVDLALLSDADGVHLGEASLEPSDVPDCGRGAARLWVSAAWHGSGEPAPGARLLLLSPVVAPRKGLQALGTAGFESRVALAKGRWVYALGGVRSSDVRALLRAGATGVAAIGAVIAEPAPLIEALGIARA